MFTLYVNYYSSEDNLTGGFIHESDSDLFNENHLRESKHRRFDTPQDAIDFAIKTFPEGAEIEIQLSGNIQDGKFIPD